MRLFFLIFLAMVSCDHQRTTQPHHIKDSLAYDIESIKIIPSNDGEDFTNGTDCVAVWENYTCRGKDGKLYSYSIPKANS